MNKKVSIIIPCFNGERFIDRCLHSIEIQNYPHIEVKGLMMMAPNIDAEKTGQQTKHDMKFLVINRVNIQYTTPVQVFVHHQGYQ